MEASFPVKLRSPTNGLVAEQSTPGAAWAGLVATELKASESECKKDA